MEHSYSINGLICSECSPDVCILVMGQDILQLFFQFMLDSKVIFESDLGPDDTWPFSINGLICSESSPDVCILVMGREWRARVRSID